VIRSYDRHIESYGYDNELVWERVGTAFPLQNKYGNCVPNRSTQTKPCVRLFDVRPLLSVTQLIHIENPIYIYACTKKKHFLENFHAQEKGHSTAFNVNTVRLNSTRTHQEMR